MATRKIDWFKASRTLSDSVSEYMRCVVWKKEYSIRYAKKAEPFRAILRALEKGELHAVSSTDEELKASTMLKLAELDAEHARLVDEFAKFELSDSAKALRKALRKGEGVTAIEAFFDAYGLDIRGTGFAEQCFHRAGMKPFDARTYVNSNGCTVTAEDLGRVFQHVFTGAYEAMVQAGTIKPQQVPALMMWEYNKCYDAKRKAAKKAAKKA